MSFCKDHEARLDPDLYLTQGVFRVTYDGERYEAGHPKPYLYSLYVEYYDRVTLELVDRVGTGRRFEFVQGKGMVEYFSK